MATSLIFIDRKSRKYSTCEVVASQFVEPLINVFLGPEPWISNAWLAAFLSREIVPVYVPGASSKMTKSVSASASFVDTAADKVRQGAISLPVSVYVSEDRFESTKTYAYVCVRTG